MCVNTARGSVLLNCRSALIGLCVLIQISILSSLVSSIGFTGSGTVSLPSSGRHALRAVTLHTLFPQSQPSQNGKGVGPAIATTRFDLVGLNIASGPITQSVPVNTPTAVTTTLQVPVGSNPQQILAGFNPNYRIRGDLSGPSFAMPRPLEARIGEPLLVPVMSKTGDHRVQNLRVVNGPGGLAGSTTGQVPGGAESLPETVAGIVLTPSALLTASDTLRWSDSGWLLQIVFKHLILRPIISTPTTYTDLTAHIEISLFTVPPARYICSYSLDH